MDYCAMVCLDSSNGVKDSLGRIPVLHTRQRKAWNGIGGDVFLTLIAVGTTAPGVIRPGDPKNHAITVRGKKHKWKNFEWIYQLQVDSCHNRLIGAI